MKILVASDEWYDVDAVIVRELEARGHTIVPVGAVLDHMEHPWVQVAEEAAGALPDRADEAVLLCWSGTGVTMAANKLPGIRAALCVDAHTARAARLWNHANVLCLSHRTLSADVAREILEAWLAPYDPQVGQDGVDRLAALDSRTRG